VTEASAVTEEVIASASACDDARLRRVFESLVRHLHAFVDEVALAPAEWLAGVQFLTATGHMCDEYRQEFMLLSDTLGVTSLVDEIAHRTNAGATESSVLGPFYNENPPEIAQGESIAAMGEGVPLDVRGRVRDRAGAGIGGAVVDVWGTDGEGLYDSQHHDHPSTAADASARHPTAASRCAPFSRRAIRFRPTVRWARCSSGWEGTRFARHTCTSGSVPRAFGR